MMGIVAEPSSQRDGALDTGGCVSPCRTNISVPLSHAGPLIAAQSQCSRTASTQAAEPAGHGGGRAHAPRTSSETLLALAQGAAQRRPGNRSEIFPPFLHFDLIGRFR